MKYFRNYLNSSRKISLNEEIERPNRDQAKLNFYNTIRDYFNLKMTKKTVDLTEVDPSIVCSLKRKKNIKQQLAVMPGFYCWVCYSSMLSRGAFAFDLDPNSPDIIVYSFDDPSEPVAILDTDTEFERFLDINKIDQLYGLTTNAFDETKLNRIINLVDEE